MQEQRKFRRFVVPDGKVFLLNHFSAKVGWVKDLSSSGLSFEFIYKEGAVVESEVVDLFSYDFDQFFLSDLPCEKIYEIKGKENNTNRKTKRCGLQFKNLDPQQKSQIEFLIHNHLNIT